MRGRGGPEGPERAASPRERSVDRLAYLLDDSIPIPGTGRRIGIDAVIGLVPGLGDVAGTALSGVIVVQAARMGAPFSVLLRMVLNVGIEALVGAIPFVGDLFDAWWKANRRNARLLHAARLLLLLLGGIAALAWLVFRAVWGAIT